MDKRVKTTHRRLLNGRLFAGGDKKSRREDRVDAISANSVDGVDPVTDSNRNNSIGRSAQKLHIQPSNTQVKAAFGTTQNSESSGNNGEENGKHTKHEKLSTLGSSKLPPLRVLHMPLSRVYTPSNYPKWGLFVTASQRSMLMDSMQRDKLFLSRQRVSDAALCGSSTRDSHTLIARSSENQQRELAENESALDHDKSDLVRGKTSNKQDGTLRAQKRPFQLSHTFTYTSARSPSDIDNRSLRKLLQELYKDKEFMDKLINQMDEEHLDFPDTLTAEDVKCLSELGRTYLLQRACYWETIGPLNTPRPAVTALGLRLRRNNTGFV